MRPVKPAKASTSKRPAGGKAPRTKSRGATSDSAERGPGALRSRAPIVLRGVRTHNLRGVDCDIPSGQLTVITGVSGSGKSSLAFDTLFAEGQRRYVESLSTYARQFLDRMPRPEADSIENIPPAIALEQKNTVRNARSTVGTATEINDYLRLLFGKAGETWCPDCGVAARAWSADAAARASLAFGEGARVMVLAPLALPQGEARRGVLAKLLTEGHTRVLVEGELAEVDDASFELPAKLAVLPVLIDRVVAGEGALVRLAGAVESAYRLADGRALLRTTEGAERRFSCAYECPQCARPLKEPDGRYLNFNSPLGACTTCEGFGRTTGIDWGKVVPNPRLPMSERPIAPWNGEQGAEMYDLFETFNARDFRIPTDVAFADLSESQRGIILYGKGKWPGVKGFFGWLETKRYKVQARIALARYRSYEPCPDCGGSRIAAAGRMLRFAGRSFAELAGMSVRDLRAWFDGVRLPPWAEEAVERPLSATRSRLRYLDEVGLGYLSLARATRTLSGGEAQRINLATALGGALTDTLYVLDEPTVGLHATDTGRLITILRRLVDAGNTVVVVEHDLDVIRASDRVIDIGPDAGEHGGRVVFSGSPAELAAHGGASRTAPYLRGGGRPRGGVRAPGGRHGRRVPRGWITIEGAHENNLRHVTARVPLGVLCVVTGVSGSGKSSLVKNCLYGSFRRERGESDVDPGRIMGLHGAGQLADMILVDQSPPARSLRSNPATFLKAYEHIRGLFASTREAVARRLTPRDFSFNVKGGRCETCEGTGRQTVEMLFLADVEVVCESCDGRRFQSTVLDIRWNGRTINEVLEMTVAEGMEFFAKERRVVEGLRPLADVGLGYLRLGQSTSTLSGGEAQRLKIAAHLAEAEETGPALLLFDEPTTGLHARDIDVLLGVFDRLLERGFSVLAIEHNMELIRRADHVIDLGPGGGDQGGNIVFSGTPEELAGCEASVTGRFLRGSLVPIGGGGA